MTVHSRNEKVMQVLRVAESPLMPTDIAWRIDEPWCCGNSDVKNPQSAQISPILKRIGAKRVDGGWIAAESQAAAEKCCNCRFYHIEREIRHGIEDDQPLHPDDFESECRRYPPVRCDATYSGALVGQNIHRDAYGGPSVQSQGWCGEWKAAIPGVRP